MRVNLTDRQEDGVRIRSGFAVLVLLGAGLFGLGTSMPARADVCVGIGSVTFDNPVWYGPLVPAGMGADPVAPNGGTFSLSTFCSGTLVGSLDAAFAFPNGALCERWSGGTGSLDGTGEIFTIEMLGGVVVLQGGVTGLAKITPAVGTSCRYDQGGTQTFTDPWIVCTDADGLIACA